MRTRTRHGFELDSFIPSIPRISIMRTHLFQSSFLRRHLHVLGAVCSAALWLSACGGASDVSNPSVALDQRDVALTETLDTGSLPEALPTDPQATLWVPTVVVDAASPAQALSIRASSSRTLVSEPVQSLATAFAAVPTPDPGVLMLLLPDGHDVADPGVAAWVDAASELGVRVQPMTDAQFMALGDAARGFAGLILPDGLHVQATDELLSAVRQYTEQGGRSMLAVSYTHLRAHETLS
jgi:hypothetical protein